MLDIYQTNKYSVINAFLFRGSLDENNIDVTDDHEADMSHEANVGERFFGRMDREISWPTKMEFA